MNFGFVALAIVTAVVPGHFALQSGFPAVAPSLHVTPLPRGRARIDFVQTRDGSPVRDYEIDMTKRLHMIIISDDFRTFEHVHPALLPDGHFVVATAVPSGSYHIYTDTTVRGIGQQVFRFDVGPSSKPPVLKDRSTARAGPYTIGINTTRLRAGGRTTITMRISKDGRPATDLLPYLGAAGHAVFISIADLSYLHVHPMLPGQPMADMGSMSGMSASEMTPEAGPHLLLNVAVRERGRYRLWFQFRSKSGLYVAPFDLTAR